MVQKEYEAKMREILDREKSDRSHVVLWAKEVNPVVVFLRPLGLPTYAL